MIIGPEGVPVTVAMDPVGCCAAAGIWAGPRKSKPAVPARIVKVKLSFIQERIAGNFLLL